MKPLKDFMLKKDGEKEVIKKHRDALKKHTGPNGSKTMKDFHQQQLDKHEIRLKYRKDLLKKTKI
jgi:hypothetical protein